MARRSDHMRMQLACNHKPSFLARVATAARPISKLWTSLFGGIAWPYIELAIRLWIAKLFGFFGFMQMLHWQTTLAVASQENPIPFLAPNSAAFLSTAIYIVCAALLAIGFMTRYTALPLVLLSLITQLRYTPFDTQLFWIALAGWLAIYGAGPISVDNLLRRGLNDSRPAHSTNYRLFRAPESMRHAAVLLFLPGVVGNRFAHVGYFALLGR